ncbi:MFS transporter [Planctomycetota bacterium]
MKNASITRQWVQLTVLTYVHFIVDVFAGMLPALLPKIRDDYTISLTRGIILLTVMSIVCNGMQIATGNLRARQRQALFLPVGLLLSTCMCLMAMVPQSGSAEYWFYVMAVVSGTGIAIVHPEGLRAIHALDKIAGSISTAVFMMGGFFGFAVGAWLSTELVTLWELKGLYILIPLALIGLGAMYLFRVRLAVEEDHENNNRVEKIQSLPFLSILLMAVPAAISTTIIMSLLPTRLRELELELTFGGLSSMMLVGGGVLGSLLWAWLAHKRGHLVGSIAALLLGIPFFLFYLKWMRAKPAVWLLFGGGFCTIAAYPLMVTMSRYARGASLGLRMALMVGGTWGVASLVLAGLGPIADALNSVQPILNWFWVGYVISGMVGIWILYHAKKTGRGIPRLPEEAAQIDKEECLSGLPNA